MSRQPAVTSKLSRGVLDKWILDKKRCTSCGKVKPLSDYHHSRGNGHRYDRYPVCKQCRSREP